MKILSRYIIRQHVGPFVFGLFIITLIFMLNLVFKELNKILSKGLDFWVVLEFFALNLAWIVALAAPMAALMASLMAFGQLSADNEITAMKASGVSLYRAILPVVLTAAALTVFLIWFNNYVLPDSNHRLRLLARDITMKRPTVNLEPGYLYEDLPDISIRVEGLKEKEGYSEIENVLIFDRSDPNINRTIIAKNGDIYVDKKSGLFRVTLFDGEIHDINKDKLNQYTTIKFPKYVMTIPIPDMILKRRNSQYRGDREQSAAMMRKEIAENNKLIATRRENLQKYIELQAQRYFPERKSADTLASALPILPEHIKKSSRYQYNLQRQLRIARNVRLRIKAERDVNHSYALTNKRLLVEIYKKYSIPFACIVFVLIGAPLGIMAHRGNMAVSGGISLVFFIIYWIFLIGGEELADRNMLSPFLAMWLANIIVGGFGVYLLIHTVREMSIINFKALTKLLPKQFRWKTDENS
ncbi:MAG: YjgP/YjgQ family permease [Calditrichaeota bacterium]|nr:YjgP/YjgQ family permease [Calditrichota bacterium]